LAKQVIQHQKRSREQIDDNTKGIHEARLIFLLVLIFPGGFAVV
jgi:hypothetical protein